MNFFSLHSNSSIGYKKLTDADLGLGSSHQTHIGLFDDTLNFISEEHQTSLSKLIYKNQSTSYECLLDFIKNPNGTYRSPKIRSGKFGTSVVKEIRKIVKQFTSKQDWYLIWFCLDNEDLVFHLFHNHSDNFNYINNLLPYLNRGGNVNKTSPNFDLILKHLVSLTEDTNIKYLQELETAAEVGFSDVEFGLFKQFDIVKANKLIALTGKKGEEMIDNYLDKQKFEKNIADYHWLNKSTESGLPFDFQIKDNASKVICMDVKTTSYKFDQNMVFSNKEIEFISSKSIYHVYRVYKVNETTPSFKICENPNLMAVEIVKKLKEFNVKIEDINVGLLSMKLKVSPLNNNLKFSNEILLT